MVVSPFTTIGDYQSLEISGTDVYFSSLTLGDYSKLIIPSTLPYCNIIIDTANFGDFDQIIADGLNGGTAGRNPQDPWLLTGGWWQATESQDGRSGCGGLPGGYGQNGVPINILIGLQAAKLVSIHSAGGMGGTGGPGGQGQFGGATNPGAIIPGNMKGCGAGGNGGPGGSGGGGGNGGNIRIQLFPATATVNLPAVAKFISVKAAAGWGGVGGAGGAAGAHGDNNCPNGVYGLPGPQGPNGTFGSVQLMLYNNLDSALAHHYAK